MRVRLPPSAPLFQITHLRAVNDHSLTARHACVVRQGFALKVEI